MKLTIALVLGVSTAACLTHDEKARSAEGQYKAEMRGCVEDAGSKAESQGCRERVRERWDAGAD